ncbi:MAG: quinone-dependent dihydroorotate dehydrogenase [Verrucomicrobiales bacterium]
MTPFLYRNLLRPVFFGMGPEQAHDLAMQWASLSSRSRILSWMIGWGCKTPTQAQELFGLTFPNPVGLAAGLDKNGVALPVWEKMGFGFIEIGTVTPRPQPGNPKPRLFRVLEDHALINRMGFNNDGAEVVAERLQKLRARGRWPKVPVGINIGKNRDTPLEEAHEDYEKAFRILRNFGDYFVINISSPNTPGLRSLQQAGALERLLLDVQESNAELERPKPILVKISPDLGVGDLEELIDVAQRRQVSGFVATNTSVDSSLLSKPTRQEGGISGRPLQGASTRMVKFLTRKSKLPVIGVGGVRDAESAREKIAAGASLLQVYTAFIYHGPGVARNIMRELLQDTQE